MFLVHLVDPRVTHETWFYQNFLSSFLPRILKIKFFLTPDFPLIGGIFVLKSGLTFSFWAREVPEPRVRKSPQKQPKMAIFAKIDFWGLKYPPEVLVELKTCSSICGHMCTPFWTAKIWQGRQWGSGKVKIWPKITPILPLIAPYSDLPWPPLSTRSIFFGSKWCVHVSRI